MPNVSYTIQQIKARASLHHEGYKAANTQYQGYDTVNQRHGQS